MSVQVEGYRNENFESLEAAVLETPRGRWFLEEYAKRQRSAETLAILDILKKLENSMTGSSFMPPSKAVEPAQPLKTEQLKFFKQDEEMFVEPTIIAPSLSVVSTTPKEEIAAPAEPKGAKLKIQRLPAAPEVEETRVAQAESTTLATPVETPAMTAAPAPAGEPKQRVVIIRRPASEASEIPMMEEDKSEVAA
jgi:hypothetical protein